MKKLTGRPKLKEGEKKHMISIRLPIYIINFMIDSKKKEGSQAVMVEKALVKTYKIKKDKS